MVTADNQSSGYGKLGSRWFSYLGNLLVTYIIPCPYIKRDIIQKDILQFTQTASLSVCHALKMYNLPAQVKWYNDVLLNQKKICGILLEITEINCKKFLIAGIGVNLISSAPLPHIACISDLYPCLKIDKHTLAYDILHHMLQYLAEPQYLMHERYLAELAYMNQMRRFYNSKNLVHGIFKGITEDCKIILSVNDNYQTLSSDYHMLY